MSGVKLRGVGKQRKVGGKYQAAPQSVRHIDLLHRALGWIVGEKIFNLSGIHGNTSWQVSHLITLALLWAWSDQSQLTKAFEEGRLAALISFPDLSLHTYQGFIRALTTWTERFKPVLWSRLWVLMEQGGGKYWRLGEFLALAVDGSRITVPRTKENEQAFAAANFGKGAKARSRRKWKNKKRRSKKLGAPVKPQIWLTMIWHMGLKMPWCWKSGPSTSSERRHFLDLLKDHVFPRNTLFCADAGFVGHEFWTAILEAGHHFLIRVGGNVQLLRKLGKTRQQGDLVYCWPRNAMYKKRTPLVLRLIQFQGARGSVYLLTNVLDSNRLSPKQAREFYRLRWGVELQFRALKQTFGRSKLRSRTPDRALVELDWSLMGLWVIQLFAVREQIEIDIPPERSSVALALAVFRDLLGNRHQVAASPRMLKLTLREATQDSYERNSSKRGRYRPNQKDAPTATMPKIRNATSEERKSYARLQAAA
jgi:hypothetical protein